MPKYPYQSQPLSDVETILNHLANWLSGQTTTPLESYLRDHHAAAKHYLDSFPRLSDNIRAKTEKLINEMVGKSPLIIAHRILEDQHFTQRLNECFAPYAATALLTNASNEIIATENARIKAEAEQRAVQLEIQRIANGAEAKRLAVEAEAKRLVDAAKREAKRRDDEAKREAKRRADEAEARKRAEEEAEAKRTEEDVSSSEVNRQMYTQLQNVNQGIEHFLQAKRQSITAQLGRACNRESAIKIIQDTELAELNIVLNLLQRIKGILRASNNDIVTLQQINSIINNELKKQKEVHPDLNKSFAALILKELSYLNFGHNVCIGEKTASMELDKLGLLFAGVNARDISKIITFTQELIANLDANLQPSCQSPTLDLRFLEALPWYFDIFSTLQERFLPLSQCNSSLFNLPLSSSLSTSSSLPSSIPAIPDGTDDPDDTFARNLRRLGLSIFSTPDTSTSSMSSSSAPSNSGTTAASSSISTASSHPPPH